MSFSQSRICKGCWEQMRLPVPLRGPASIPFRAFGIRPSRMNPNTCTICELMFTRVMKARKITVDVTVLFADLRGYTTLSQSLSADAVSSLLDDFYDECAEAIWEFDGLLNKTVGDAVMAIFNFPIPRQDHAECAVLAAREIQRRCQLRRELHAGEGLDGSEFGVGIGIDSGEASFGEFGRSHRDLTAIGTVVNTAARAQAAAEAGGILVTRAVLERAQSQTADSIGREYHLKGFEKPVELYAV
ncbi:MULTISPECIES: adenylate/guanylate cyclase domain-containing protein [Sinorhizobium]|uniref:Guanylate cyclase n=2 Tax=Sinorhizobium TaxID=28105 RepID=A0A2S3YGF3_9HYPH|nr:MULTISPECIES: adenylate/guanylate cyclase domain-containing protein [Sinorhizobium]AUX77757.1 adenylate/guanylate cyclase protein [Sinorhizobium fredii]POH25316.1 guanylate cyclase [Sinorhizobium americanum]POH26526.1 guanylate cyclase [Sinorhizobium americanum]